MLRLGSRPRQERGVSGVRLPYFGQNDYLVYARALQNFPNFLARHETHHLLGNQGLAQDAGIIDDVFSPHATHELLRPAHILPKRCPHSRVYKNAREEAYQSRNDQGKDIHISNHGLAIRPSPAVSLIFLIGGIRATIGQKGHYGKYKIMTGKREIAALN